MLLMLYDHLYFEKAVENCLVKIHFGNSKVREDYKIGIIVNVTKKEEGYVFEGKQLYTYLEVVVNSESKWEVKLFNVSNKDIDEREAFKLLDELRGVCNFDLNLDWIQNKIEDLQNFRNYKFTTEDIMKINDKRLGLSKKPVTEAEFLSKKRLLEKKLNLIEGQHFLNPSKETEIEIEQIKKEIIEIKQDLEKIVDPSKDRLLKTYFKKDDKFLSFNIIGKEERAFFKRNSANPLNMWTIESSEM